MSSYPLASSTTSVLCFFYSSHQHPAGTYIFFDTTISICGDVRTLSSGFSRRTITWNFWPSTFNTMRELFVNVVYDRNALRITYTLIHHLHTYIQVHKERVRSEDLVCRLNYQRLCLSITFVTDRHTFFIENFPYANFTSHLSGMQR